MEDEGVEVLRAADLELGLGVGLGGSLGLGTSDGLGGLDQGLLDARRGSVLAAGDLDCRVSNCSRATSSSRARDCPLRGRRRARRQAWVLRLSVPRDQTSILPMLARVPNFGRPNPVHAGPRSRPLRDSILRTLDIDLDNLPVVPTRSIRTEALDVGDLLRHRGRVAGCKFQVARNARKPPTNFATTGANRPTLASTAAFDETCRGFVSPRGCGILVLQDRCISGVLQQAARSGRS